MCCRKSDNALVAIDVGNEEPVQVAEYTLPGTPCELVYLGSNRGVAVACQHACNKDRMSLWICNPEPLLIDPFHDCPQGRIVTANAPVRLVAGGGNMWHTGAEILVQPGTNDVTARRLLA